MTSMKLYHDKKERAKLSYWFIQYTYDWCWAPILQL